MDLFTVKERLKLILLFVGAGLFMGVFATWHAWQQIGLGGEGREHFLLSALVTGALAVASVVLLVSFFITKKAMKPAPIDKHRWLRVRWGANIPWGPLKYIALVVFIAAMAFVLSWFSSEGATEFTLLKKEKFKLLQGRIADSPELLKLKEKRSGKTLLGLALESGNAEAIDLLLSNGADFSSETNGPNWVVTALSNLPMLETLLRYGADPNAADANKFFPIHYAVDSKNTDALELLLKAGADLGVRTPLYQTPLVLAILAGDIPMAETLIDVGADLNQWDRRGDTVLHKAVQRKSIETVRFLLEKKANPKLFNFNNMAPIHMAAFNGQNELVELFLEDPEQINLRNEDDRTPFDHALRGYQYDTVRLLIEQGAQIDRVMANGYTALHLMLVARNYKTVRFLIEEGANVHMADPEGETVHDLMHKKQLQSLLDLVEARDLPAATTNTADAVESP